MKKPLVVLFALATAAGAGPSGKETMCPPPPPQHHLLSWFAGGSVGYLTELEEPMYSIFVGVEPGWKLGGGSISLFAEVGYADRDESYSGGASVIPLPGTIPSDSTFDLDDLEDGLKDSAATGTENTSYDLRIVPVTLNAKYERPIYRGLNGYFGAGAGAAWVDLDADAGSFGSFHANDWVFTAQIFGGVSYDFNDRFSAFAGVRWMYFDDASLRGGTLELDDDFLFEIGGRIRF